MACQKSQVLIFQSIQVQLINRKALQSNPIGFGTELCFLKKKHFEEISKKNVCHTQVTIVIFTLSKYDITYINI